jgi:translocation and assembly module TamB
MDLFAYNISQTLNGTLKAQANHTIENDNKASILMNGTVNNGAINADYLLFLNDTQTGTGHIVGNNDLSHFQTTTNSDLKVINIFIQNTPHRIAGKVIANIDLKNNVITGDLQVKNGAYNNVYYNSVIDTIDIQAKLTPNFIDVTHLNAMTNPTGTMTAQGIISMSPTVQSSLVIKTNDLMPVKNDMVSMNVNSNLNLTGSFNNLKLLGNINIDDLLILLPDLQSNETPHLNIIRKPKNETPIIATESVPLLERIQTDILVKITQGAKITGFGVQGFPFGTLNIVGNMGNPQVNGQIDIARGKIEFFGKNFKITKGGIAMKANNPLFNVAAEYKIDKTTINLSLKGTVQNPDVVLSSTPQIPKDEIVALLIFGRGKKELSPFQALQLANTVYQLSRGKSGAGSTFDIVGKTERLLNIDELNINSGDNNSVNIGAGKYISEDIYIATEYNPITANNIFRLELKLTDSIDIISRLNRTNKVNNTNNSEIMLIKSKDY